MWLDHGIRLPFWKIIFSPPGPPKGDVCLAPSTDIGERKLLALALTLGHQCRGRDEGCR